MGTYTGFTGTRITIEADSLEEAEQKLYSGDYEEDEVESWVEAFQFK